MIRRSPQEIAFRLRQEASNLGLWLRPQGDAPVTASLPLGRPETFLDGIRGAPYANGVLEIAEAVLRREFKLLGSVIHTDKEIHWRRDYLSLRESGLSYFRRIPYLDFSRVGDHKIIWELNRHQHLVTLAQAYLLSDRKEFLEDLWAQLISWLDQNPFCRGINWSSALEVAFRVLSWIWIEHLAGNRMPQPLRRRWLRSLFQHGHYLEQNLSIYFSPNTHLQGEALALHALGVLFARHRRAARWRARGAAILEQIVLTHVRPDGGHFEQSSYYHVYATDMFLFHALLEPVSEAYRFRLRKMAEYLWALSSSGEIPLLGDDDGGRLFHPFGNRRQFARGTLAACAAFFGDTPWHGDLQALNEQALWWFPKLDAPPPAGLPESALFRDTGVAVLADGNIQAIADTRAFGFGSAGHSHSHALHFTLKRADVDVLIDPGAYTYVADPAARNRFRGVASHNTVRIDGLDQADPAGPFRWNNLPKTSLRNWSDRPWHLDAVCDYRSVRHNRQISWRDGVLFVLDSFQAFGDAGLRPHRLEQFWHPGSEVTRIGPRLFELPAGVFLAFPEGPTLYLEEGGDYGWYSPAPGSRFSRPLIRAEVETEFPCSFGAALLFTSPLDFEDLRMTPSPGRVTLECGKARTDFVL